MTKEEFRSEWAKEDCTLTFDDIAAIAVDWGVCSRPKTTSMQVVLYLVLRKAGVDTTNYEIKE